MDKKSCYKILYYILFMCSGEEYFVLSIFSSLKHLLKSTKQKAHLIKDQSLKYIHWGNRPEKTANVESILLF